MSELMIAGEAFNVRVEGDEGAPVVMLAHPLGANLHVFDPLMPRLLRHFRVIRYDSRGHGASVVTPGPYSLAQLGRDAIAILDALGIAKVHWIGVSKGAVVGLWLLSHAPERIGRAVLAHVTAHFGSPDPWNERIRIVHGEGLESLAPGILENWFTKGFREHHAEVVERIWEMLLASPAEGYAGACAALRDMDLRETIRGIANPVLIIVGRHDPVTTPGLGALVASAIPGAKLLTLETAHLSCVEDPEGFNQAALEFLTVEERAMGEETPQEEAVEASQIPPPAKKSRKPKAPRQPSTATESEVLAVPAAMPEGEEPQPAGESLHGTAHAVEAGIEPMPAEEAELAPAPAAAPAPKPRKPRERRPAAAAPVPKVPAAAPAVSRAAPQPRKRPAKRAAAKKAVAKRAAVKKAVAKKAAVKKAAAKKSAPGKARAGALARRAVAKKAATKKSAAKRAPVRKIAAKKAAVRKAVVKKTHAKKAGVKKAAMKKGASRKALPRRMPGRKPTTRKR